MIIAVRIDLMLVERLLDYFAKGSDKSILITKVHEGIVLDCFL